MRGLGDIPNTCGELAVAGGWWLPGLVGRRKTRENALRSSSGISMQVMPEHRTDLVVEERSEYRNGISEYEQVRSNFTTPTVSINPQSKA